MDVLRICNYPGCSETIPHRGYCEAHQWTAERKAKERKRQAFKNAKRSNQALYNTARWRKLRAQIIKRDRVCQTCGSDTELQVHHLRPPRGDEGLFYHPDNLAVICATCHRRETAAEIRQRREGQ
jgi:5-methylcytosine-specific restriction endonuclease McrA